MEKEKQIQRFTLPQDTVEAINAIHQIENSHPFAEVFQEAYKKTLDFEKYRELWEQFRYAFEYRAQFPWLGEAHDAEKEYWGDEGGMVYALLGGFVRYSPLKDESNNPRLESTFLDNDFISRIESAVAFSSQHDFTIQNCIFSLWNAKLPVEYLSPDDLTQHIVAAISTYSHSFDSGVGPDPW